MAITLIKQPAQFFNCASLSPVIFEFTTDSVVGNFDDYVCDVVITSLYAAKSAVIRNVFPNTQTKVFSVNTEEFFKALQLNDFEFDFAGTKNLSVEKFTISLKVRDGSIPEDDSFIFDNYIFDNFVFTDGLGLLDNVDVDFYSILGERLLFDRFTNPLVVDKLTFLAPEVIEICRGFDNHLSIFTNELTANAVSVSGVTVAVTNTVGVATFKFSDAQLNAVRSLREVTCTNQNPAKKLFAIDFKEECAEVVQFRFYNPKGGFSYFYSTIDTDEADRAKTTFYDRRYSNENENRSPSAQSDVDYSNSISFKGSKIIQLKELFDMLLRSPKVEMNLERINGNVAFIECEITGTSADLHRAFDYQLKAKITNSGNFKL
jgi:hypothetical protein